VFVDLGIQHAMSMRHIVIYVLSRSTLFSHFFSQTALLTEKKNSEHKMCALIFSPFLILVRNERDMINVLSLELD
jgi:hypothetical protein